MKSIYLILAIAGIVGLGILLFPKLAYGQTANVNFTKMFEEKYPDNSTTERRLSGGYQTVYVKYESPTTILIWGDLIKLNFDISPNTDLWKAMDMLKNQYGFKLQEIITNGEGTEANPTSVYILMTK